MKHATLCLLVLAGLTGCFGKVEPEPSVCPETAPTCITPSVSCAMPGTVPATCDAESRSWSCPSGSSVYARESQAASSCSPFSAAGSPFASLGGSLVRIPVDGGRCLWVAETAMTSTGESLRNIGLVPSPSSSFGSCPETSTFGGGAPTPVVEIEGVSDSTLLVQVDGGFVLPGGDIRVVYRLFRQDATQVYGVTLLGGGFGRWDASAQRIVVPGVDGLLWDPTIDPGDASLVVDGTPYIWGCHAPEQFLTYPCAVARASESGLEYLTLGGNWAADAAVSDTATAFSSGPWISSVVPSSAGGLAHVYAVGFGSTLEVDTAPSVLGPWTAGPTLARCDLPASDPHAFCAGPVVHEELMDPTRPDEWVVSYGLGTTDATAGSTAASATLSTSYWTKLAWVTSTP